MPGVDFDNYVNEYRDIINRVSRISGERFEYFIQLRLGLMRARIPGNACRCDTMKILDFGCGTGSTERYLKDLFPYAFVYGLDSSAESIRVAQNMGLEGVTFVHSDGLALPFPDDFFDLIYSNGTYHHIDPSHHEHLIREMSRICRSGGDLFIFENNPKNPLMMRAMRKNPFDADAVVVYPTRLRELTESAGFVCMETCYYFFFPKLLRFLRFMERWLTRVPLGAQYVLWAHKTG